MPRYTNSTHKRLWVFSAEELRNKSEEKQRLLQEHILAISGDANLQKYSVTQEEENSILFFLSKNLITACKHLHVHDKAISTALAYFKRFYLTNSVCIYDPVQMMFTSIFLACKTEEINVRDISIFCHEFKGSDPKAILELEFVLISGIKFNLYVFCPHKSLKALIEKIPDRCLGDEQRKVAEAKAVENIELFLISDIAFKVSPSEIAICSLFEALSGNDDKESILKQAFGEIEKDFEAYKVRVESIVLEFKGFLEEFGKCESISRGALKKAGSLRHRLKRAGKDQKDPVNK